MKTDSTIKNVSGIIPATRTGGASPTVTKGSEIDRRDFEEAIITLHHGAIDATGKLDCKIQESDTTTDGDFADIEGAAFTQINGDTEGLASGIYQGRINLVGRKRYIRAVGTVTTDTKNATYDVIVGLHQAKEKPVIPVNPLAFSV